MSLHLHLLGGAGRIGTALVDSLQSDPLTALDNIWIYCDLTKVVESDTKQPHLNSLRVRPRCYSAFSLSTLLEERLAEENDKHLVINLRGVNNKVYWLNQPLDALELQIQACRCLVDSDLWMFPGVEIIHMSSLLCDLIESPVSLDEVCEGQESYRRPYMVSRLHQEVMLTANAYRHAIATSFIRLPAVYGFPDDHKAPWVLNSLCSQKKKELRIVTRKPNAIVHLTHRSILINYLRSLISESVFIPNRHTIRYLKPPMLRMTVYKLAQIVQDHGTSIEYQLSEDDSVRLIGDANDCTDIHFSQHSKLLFDSLRSLLSFN